jgi:hypothetical protein
MEIKFANFMLSHRDAFDYFVAFASIGKIPFVIFIRSYFHLNFFTSTSTSIFMCTACYFNIITIVPTKMLLFRAAAMK